jgi:hypothetical protein
MARVHDGDVAAKTLVPTLHRGWIGLQSSRLSACTRVLPLSRFLFLSPEST